MHFKFYLKWCHTHYALDSMLCHCHTSQVCGGWVGVPTFEVISLLFPALPYPWDMMQCVACGQMCFATRYVLRVYVRHLQSMCGCNVASWMFIPQSAMNKKKGATVSCEDSDVSCLCCCVGRFHVAYVCSWTAGCGYLVLNICYAMFICVGICYMSYILLRRVWVLRFRCLGLALCFPFEGGLSKL